MTPEEPKSVPTSQLTGQGLPNSAKKKALNESLLQGPPPGFRPEDVDAQLARMNDPRGPKPERDYHRTSPSLNFSEDEILQMSAGERLRRMREDAIDRAFKKKEK